MTCPAELRTLLLEARADDPGAARTLRALASEPRLRILELLGDDLLNTSEIAAALPRSVFPTDESGLLGHLIDDNAPDRLRQLISQLPSGRVFNQVSEVVEALGLHKEEHRF